MANTYSAGIATAYGAAVRGGYTGTYAEWCAAMADFGDKSQQAIDAAEQAAQSAADAAGSATDAADSASAAATSEGNAADSASAAATSETNAAGSASAAAQSATAAAGSATAAATSEANAAASETAAADSATTAAQELGRVQTAGAAQVAAINTEGARVLATIPADYTTLGTAAYALSNVFPLTWTLGKDITAQGNIGNNQYRAMTDMVSCTPGDVLIDAGPAQDAGGVNISAFCSTYKSVNAVNDTFVQRVVLPKGAAYTIGADITGFRITFGRGASTGIAITQEDIDSYFGVKYFCKTVGANNVPEMVDGDIYYVGPSREHTRLTSLLLYLAGDERKKTIYIDDGEYDIFAEYMYEVSAGRLTIPPDDVASSDYFGTYNAFVPNNTRIVGHGNVVLRFAPDAADITYGASRTWSPLNIYGSVEIENVTVVGHNCRYCLHNDDHNAYPGAVQRYKNCRFRYTKSDTADNRLLGFNVAVGFGIQHDGTHIFEDCEIYVDTDGNNAAYYGHDGATYKNGTLLLKNCNIHSSNPSNNRVIRLQTLATSSGHVTARFEGCYLNGMMELNMSYVNSPQNFDVTLVGCNRVPVTRVIPSGGTIVDPYPVKWYNCPLTTPDETGMIASANYAVDSFFVAGGTLYKATAAIATGETIQPGTNCVATSIAEQLTAIYARLA